MSDLPDRRYEDTRMDKLEKTIEAIQKDVGEIRVKIFNGFSHKIDSTENKVNYIDERNREEHNALIESINNLSDKFDKKFDKMMWVWISGSVSVFVGVIIYVIKGLL